MTWMISLYLSCDLATLDGSQLTGGQLGFWLSIRNFEVISVATVNGFDLVIWAIKYVMANESSHENSEDDAKIE